MAFSERVTFYSSQSTPFAFGSLFSSSTTMITSTVLHPGIEAMITGYLNEGAEKLNTDWFGTIPLFGLLELQKKGLADVHSFALRWLDFHITVQGRKNGTELLRLYGSAQVPRSRILLKKPLPSSTYAGFFGMAFVCHEIYSHGHDQRARQVALAIADMLLHDVRRHRNGLLAHDDYWDRAIPDTAFFVTEALFRGALLAGPESTAYHTQAKRQIDLYSQIFLDPEIKLAHTMWNFTEDKPGRTYWSRASGWLSWALVAGLRYLSPDDELCPRLIQRLGWLAEGIGTALDAESALHVHLDNPSTPQEVTGTAMAATALHEACRQGWIGPQYLSTANRMWAFCLGCVNDRGQVSKAYCRWARPAEEGETAVSTVSYREHAYVAGIFLRAAAEFA